MRTPGVCGGSARLDGTRIPVWLFAALWKNGATDEYIRKLYPAVQEEDLEVVRAYILSHVEEVDAELAVQEND